MTFFAPLKSVEVKLSSDTIKHAHVTQDSLENEENDMVSF